MTGGFFRTPEILLPGEGDHTLSEFLWKHEGTKTIYVLGPEGDSSERERGVLREALVPSVHLGTRRLWAETAAFVVLSIVNEHIQNRKE